MTLFIFISPLKSEPAPEAAAFATGTVQTATSAAPAAEVGAGKPTDAVEAQVHEDVVNPEFLKLKESRLRLLAKAVPGEIQYFQGAKVTGSISGISVTDIDADRSPGIIFLTTGSMEVFQFSGESTIERVWEGKFVEEFPFRGLAVSVFPGVHSGTNFIFVSMNKFAKSFAYKWINGRMEKTGRANGAFVDVVPEQSVNLISNYGNGITSFSGPATHFVDTSREEPQKHNFPIPEDYYSGCILKWIDISVGLARVAVVTEDGIIKVYQGPGKLHAKTSSAYGGRIACRTTPDSEFIIATTESGTNDAIVVLKIIQSSIVEIWRAPPMGGAITSFTSRDLDGDGEPEVIGVLETDGGKDMIFRVLPDFSKEPQPDRD